jgi:polyisoprenoid-binding protein YceI
MKQEQENRNPHEASGAMSAHYQFDAERSRFIVQAFAGGLLSFVAHSPKFAVREFTGGLLFDPADQQCVGLEITITADSLDLLEVSRPADRTEIESRMRREVLELAAYPEIRFQAVDIACSTVAEDQLRVSIAGMLTLHGVAKRETVEAELYLYNDGIRLRGQHSLRMSEYRIRPVTALAGTIQLKDRLSLTFDLVGVKETS